MDRAFELATQAYETLQSAVVLLGNDDRAAEATTVLACMENLVCQLDEILVEEEAYAKVKEFEARFLGGSP